jgi:hypothetical protein
VEARILTCGHHRFKRVGARRVPAGTVDADVEVWAVLIVFRVDLLRLEAP